MQVGRASLNPQTCTQSGGDFIGTPAWKVEVPQQLRAQVRGVQAGSTQLGKIKGDISRHKKNFNSNVVFCLMIIAVNCVATYILLHWFKVCRRYSNLATSGAGAGRGCNSVISAPLAGLGWADSLAAAGICSNNVAVSRGGAGLQMGPVPLHCQKLGTLSNTYLHKCSII